MGGLKLGSNTGRTKFRVQLKSIGQSQEFSGKRHM